MSARNLVIGMLLLSGCAANQTPAQQEQSMSNALADVSVGLQAAAQLCVTAASTLSPAEGLQVLNDCQAALGPAKAAVTTAASELSSLPADGGVPNAACAGLLAVNALEQIVAELTELKVNVPAVVETAIAAVDFFLTLSGPNCSQPDAGLDAAL